MRIFDDEDEAINGKSDERKQRNASEVHRGGEFHGLQCLWIIKTNEGTIKPDMYIALMKFI